MKIKHIEFSGREVAGIALLLLFVLGATSFVPSQFLDSSTYVVAYQVREHIVNGVPADFFIQLTAFGYKLFALLLTGAAVFQRPALSLFLTVVSPAVAMLTALFAYFALRERGFESFPSLVASLLFVSVPLFILSNASGVYSAQSLSVLFCAAALFAFSEKSLPRALVSGVLLALAYLVSPAAIVFAVAFVLALLLAAFVSGAGVKGVLPILALAIPVVISLALSPRLPSQVADPLALFSSMRLLLPIAVASLAAFINPKGSIPYFSALMLLLAFACGLFNPLLMALALLVPACLGATIILSTNTSKAENSAAWFALVFVLALGFMSLGADPTKAALVSLIAGAGVVAVLYMYEFKFHLVPFVALSLLVAISLSSSLAIAQSPALQASHAGGVARTSLDPQTAAALSWLRENASSEANIAFIGDPGQFRFISEHRLRAGDDGRLAKFLASNESASTLSSAGITYALVTIDTFDNPEKIRNLSDSNFNAESFSYLLTLYSGGTPAYALFESDSGDLLYRPVDSAGKLSLGNSELRDQDLNLLAIVPFSQLRMLDDTLAYSDPNNRVIMPGAAYSTNAFKIFFGTVPGLEKVYGNGKAIVFKVG